MTTFMPTSANARAIPRPMPLEPPVMKATLSSILLIGIFTFGQGGVARATGSAFADVDAKAATPVDRIRKSRRVDIKALPTECQYSNKGGGRSVGNRAVSSKTSKCHVPDR